MLAAAIALSIEGFESKNEGEQVDALRKKVIDYMRKTGDIPRRKYKAVQTIKRARQELEAVKLRGVTHREVREACTLSVRDYYRAMLADSFQNQISLTGLE